jgi:hypothetical protein
MLDRAGVKEDRGAIIVFVTMAELRPAYIGVDAIQRRIEKKGRPRTKGHGLHGPSQESKGRPLGPKAPPMETFASLIWKP